MEGTAMQGRVLGRGVAATDTTQPSGEIGSAIAHHMDALNSLETLAENLVSRLSPVLGEQADVKDAAREPAQPKAGSPFGQTIQSNTDQVARITRFLTDAYRRIRL